MPTAAPGETAGRSPRNGTDDAWEGMVRDQAGVSGIQETAVKGKLAAGREASAERQPAAPPRDVGRG